MGFLSLSDATALGVTQGIEDTLAGIKQQEDKDLKDARRKAENAAAAAKDITIKYEARERAAETTGQGLLKNAAFRKAVDNLKTKYADQFSNVSDLQIAARFGKSYLIHHAKDTNDSPLKFAIRSAQTLNEQIMNESVDPNLLSLNTIDTPTDTQTKELTAMEKMTPKGRKMEMEQSYRPSGIGGEAFDTAMLGGVPTVPVNQTESLTKAARPKRSRSEEKYQNKALLNALELSATTDASGEIDFSTATMNPNNMIKNALTPDDVERVQQQLTMLRAKFDSFLNKMDILPTDKGKILEAAQKFRTLLINKDFSFNEETFRIVTPDNIDELMKKLPKKTSVVEENKPIVVVPKNEDPGIFGGTAKERREALAENKRKRDEKYNKQRNKTDADKEKESMFSNKELREEVKRQKKAKKYPFKIQYGKYVITYNRPGDDFGSGAVITEVKKKTDG